MGFIYKITSLSNKMYVGQTKKKVPRERWKQHCASSSRCDAIKNAITKYGAENMKFEVVEECADELLNDREQHWIRELNTLSPHGYNLRSGGGVGESVSDETKARMSAMKQQSSIDKNGYVGTIKEWRGSVSAIAPDRSNLGTYSTREEAEEALRAYTRDPENFVPKLSDRTHGTGGVCLHRNRSGRVRWLATVNQNKEKKYLGRYDTKKEAENACARYLENPDGFVMPPTETRKNGTGCVWKRESGRFSARYKDKNVGTFDTEAQAEAAILAHKEKIEGKKPLKE